ncbi:hypothetical protein HK097_006206, partial [Rhizophlyctis rosea]
GQDREADIGSDDDDYIPPDDSSSPDRPASALGLQEEERVRRQSLPSWVIEDRLAKAGISADSNESGKGLQKGKSMRMMLSVGDLGMVGEDEEGDEEGDAEEGGVEGVDRSNDSVDRGRSAESNVDRGRSAESSVERVTVVVPDVEVAGDGSDASVVVGGRSVRRVSALEDRMGRMMAELNDDSAVSFEEPEQEVTSTQEAEGNERVDEPAKSDTPLSDSGQDAPNGEQAVVEPNHTVDASRLAEQAVEVPPNVNAAGIVATVDRPTAAVSEASQAEMPTTVDTPADTSLEVAPADIRVEGSITVPATLESERKE